MSSGSGTLRAIAWREVFPWLILTRAFRLALSFRVLLLTTAALIATVAGWRLIGEAFENADDPVLKRHLELQGVWPWTLPLGAVGPPLAGGEARIDALPVVGDYLNVGPVTRAWLYLSLPFRMLTNSHLQAAGLAYALLCCLWAVLVWALFGGAVTRVAALQLTREQPLGLRPALDHARSKFGAYFLAPLMPLVGVLIVGFLPWLLGLLMRLDAGVLIAGILWPLVIVAGLLITILLLGLLFGWPLMWPTIAAEGTDSFDALSRSYHYVYQRPLRVVLYAFVASLLGLVGVVLVNFFAASVIEFSLWPTRWGMGEARSAEVLQALTAPANSGGMLAGGAGLIAFWLGLVNAVAVAFQFAFFWVSATAIYLLLRRDIDGTDLDEIFLEEAEMNALPPLETDLQGVPSVPEGA